MKSLVDYADHMRLCHELKQSLNSLMGWSGSLTHRQFMVWQRWLKDEWEKPSRTDRYIMRLIAVVDNLFRKETLPEDTYMIKYTNKRSKSTITESPAVKRPLPSDKPRKIPIDPTGETVIVPLIPDTLSQETDEEVEARIKRSETIWLSAFMNRAKSR